MINMVRWICYAQSVAYQVYHLSKRWTISIEEPIKQDLRLICIYTVIIIIIIIIISIILITILITIAITYSHVIIIAPYCTSIP